MLKKTLIIVFILTNLQSSYANTKDDDDFIDNFPTTSKPIYDPLEGINRKVYGFNKTIDTYAIKPITVFYKEYTPIFFQNGITNFSNYLSQPFYIVNYSLQGNGEMAGEAAGRFLVNTIGLGFIDFASSANIPNDKTDFGETFGVWGVNEGPYVVLPILGGATLRDNASKLGLEIPLSIESNFDTIPKYTTMGLKLLDKRKSLLQVDNLIEESSLDEYSFVRDSVIQSKRYRIDNLKEK